MADEVTRIQSLTIRQSSATSDGARDRVYSWEPNVFAADRSGSGYAGGELTVATSTEVALASNASCTGKAWARFQSFATATGRIIHIGKMAFTSTGGDLFVPFLSLDKDQVEIIEVSTASNIWAFATTGGAVSAVIHYEFIKAA